MKYAYIDTNGKILGWYSDDIHGTLVKAIYDEDGKLIKDSYFDVSKIPTPNIEVDENTWKEAVNKNANAYDEATKTFIIKDFSTFKDKQNQKLSSIQTTYQTESTKSVSYKDVLYKGGDASAGAISGAVTLAQSLQETEVKIIDADDKPNIMTFDEALELSGLIAKAWRTAFFRYKELKVQISNAATVEELDLISWEEV